MNEVYVCMEENPDDGVYAVGVYDNENSAREWMRRKFLEFKEECPEDEHIQDNDNWYWEENDCVLDKDFGTGHKWGCAYLLESYGWYVAKLPVRK